MVERREAGDLQSSFQLLDLGFLFIFISLTAPLMPALCANLRQQLRGPEEGTHEGRSNQPSLKHKAGSARDELEFLKLVFRHVNCIFKL